MFHECFERGFERMRAVYAELLAWLLIHPQTSSETKRMLPFAPSARSVSAALTLAGPPPSSKKSNCFCILSPFVSISVSIRTTTPEVAGLDRR